MNILFLPSWYESDVEKNAGVFFTEQALALKKMGNNVTIAIVDILNYPYKSDKPKFKVFKEERHGIDVYRMFVPSYMTGHIPGIFFSYYARYYKKLFKYMFAQGLSFDVMYAHSFWHAGYIATLLKKEFNLPLIVQEHRSMLITGEFSNKVNKYLKATVDNADAFYCVSKKLRDNVYTRTGLSNGIEILPNMVDDLFQYKQLNNYKFTYTFIGTLNENKRIIQLLKCFEKVCESNRNVVLKIAGDGPQLDQVNELINSSAVMKDSVDVLGLLPREKVLDLLTETNVLVLPSAFETFGVVCIEAMAVGRPVICTRNGASDFVNDSNGILIDVDSDDQLIDAMIKIFQNYSEYNQSLISENCVKAYSSANVMSAVISEMKLINANANVG